MKEFNEDRVRKLEEKNAELQKTQAELMRLKQELEQRLRERTGELRAANVELEATHAELDVFNRSVSHDLRSPLTEIYAFSQMLLARRTQQPEPDGRDFAGKIMQAAQRMEFLIKELDKLSRIKHYGLHRRPFDLSVAVSALAARLRGIDTPRKVEFVIAPGVIVEADGDLLQVALDHLLNNAWKYTSECPRAKIEFGQLEQTGQAIYFVRDNGAGFDMGSASRLFRFFERLHSKEELVAAGIGLTMVQRVIARHGGSIWVESKPGEGAAFYFTLAP